jgi:hypothetical protein
MKHIPAIINLLASLFPKIYAVLLPPGGRRFVSRGRKVKAVFWIVFFEERCSSSRLTLWEKV